MFNIDAFSIAGYSAAVPYVGCILTGIILSARLGCHTRINSKNQRHARYAIKQPPPERGRLFCGLLTIDNGEVARHI